MKTYVLSPSGFSALRTRLLELGVTLPDGNAGRIRSNGVVLEYQYDGETLTLKGIEKPFIAPWSMVWAKVDEWLDLASS